MEYDIKKKFIISKHNFHNSLQEVEDKILFLKVCFFLRILVQKIAWNKDSIRTKICRKCTTSPQKNSKRIARFLVLS